LAPGQNTVELDDLQRTTILAINHTLVRELDRVNSTVHYTVLQDKLNAQESMTQGFNALRERVTQLGTTVNATCQAQTQAVLALKDTFKRQNALRHNEMATLERDAASTKTYLTRRLEVVRQQILALKNVLATDVEQGTARQAAMKGEVATYQSDALGRSEAASNAAMAASDSKVNNKLAAEVAKWTQVLQTNEAAATAEAARLQALLDTFKTKEAEQHESVQSQVASMLKTVADNQAAAEEAAATLRVGLAATDARLTSTSTDIRDMGATDQELVRSEIAEGLQSLQGDFSREMAEQDATMKEALRQRREKLEGQAAALEAQLVRKWRGLNQSLTELQDQQVAAAKFHEQEISDLTSKDRETRELLRSSMESMGQSLAAAKAAFQTPQTAAETGEVKGFKELLDKLNSAVQVLQHSGVQLGEDVDEQVDNVTTRLRSVRGDVEQAQTELSDVQTDDKAAISEDVSTGLDHLKASVLTTIEGAMDTVRSSLNSRLSQLSTSITDVRTSATTTEDTLKNRMATLEQKQSNDDSAQDREISALLASYREMVSREDARAKELSSNISTVEKTLDAGIASLDRARATDSQEVQSAIMSSVTGKWTGLQSSINSQKAGLLEEIKTSMTGNTAAVQALDASRDAAYTQDQTAIANLQARKRSERNALEADLAQLSASVEQLRRNLQTNTTGIRSSMNLMVRRVRAAQKAMAQQQDSDLQDFRRVTSQDVADLRNNFTAILRDDLLARKEYLRAHFTAMSQKVEDEYKEPRAEADKDQESVRAMVEMQTDRMKAAIDALNLLNGTSMAWGSRMLQQLANIDSRLSRERTANDNRSAQIALSYTTHTHTHTHTHIRTNT